MINITLTEKQHATLIETIKGHIEVNYEVLEINELFDLKDLCVPLNIDFKKASGNVLAE